ncbi:SPRY-domain-containing protein [Gigaspora margarita]|uniref:SPRY-domain-containing protein n=1 Tax=Gigaspora margarita TaxID=4874 RepID=A0A8H3WVV2_GIGMA|nr:SPRY-domain-containing protein [Gigaspora margarita]
MYRNSKGYFHMFIDLQVNKYRMDLPTAWDFNDKSTLLIVDANGLSVNYVGCAENIEDENIEDVVIRANIPIPSECKLFYFEIDIVDMEKGIIAIGFCTNSAKLSMMPGCEADSWGYHSDDGDFFNCSFMNEPYGPGFKAKDTIGCYLNFINKTAFYTKNGVNLGIALRDLKDNLFPCIGLRGGFIETNFGHKKFKYAGLAMTNDDIGDELIKDKWVNQYKNILVDNLEVLANSLEIKPDDTLALRYRAETHLMLKKYDELYDDINNLLKVDENNEWALETRNVIEYRSV